MCYYEKSINLIMKSEEYLALENLSPYSKLNADRLKNPKQTFQWFADFLEKNIFSKKNYRC